MALNTLAWIVVGANIDIITGVWKVSQLCDLEDNKATRGDL